MEHEMIVRQLKALGDPTRLHIIQLLAGCCCGTAAVRDDGGVESPTAGEVCCHLTGADKITSTVSHHLHELKNAGLIRIEKRGKASVCSLEPEALQALGHQLIRLANANNAACEC